MLLCKMQQLRLEEWQLYWAGQKMLFLFLPTIPVWYYKARSVLCCRQLSFMPKSHSFLSLPPHLKPSWAVNAAKKSWSYRPFWTLRVEASLFFSCHMAKSFYSQQWWSQPATSQICVVLNWSMQLTNTWSLNSIEKWSEFSKDYF